MRNATLRLAFSALLAMSTLTPAHATQHSSAQSLVEMAATGQHAELASAVDSLVADGEVSPAARERALYGFTVGVRRLPADDIPLDVLERLQTYEPMALVAHPERPGVPVAPRYDIAGAATGTLALREHRLAVRSLQAALREDPREFWRSLRSAKSGPGRRALTEALQTAEESLAWSVAWEIEKDSLREPAVADAAAVLAVRLRDPELAGAVIESGDPTAARRVLESLAVFPGPEALELVRRGAEQPGTGSIAIATAGPLAARSSEAREWLMGQLRRPGRGATAAAALAQLKDPGVESRIIGMLYDASDGPGLRNALLFLHLVDTTGSREALAEFAADPSMPEDLRREVARWQ